MSILRVRRAEKCGGIAVTTPRGLANIKVIEGEKGLFIARPSKKATDGEYRDIAHPINSSTRENLQKVILESYEKALEEPEEVI